MGKNDYYGNANVYKDANTGRYRCQLPYHDEEGNRKFISKLAPKKLKTVREQKAFLRQWEQEKREEAAHLGYVSSDKRKATVSEMVTEYLEYQFKIGEIVSSTRYAQLHLIQKNVTPYIGDIAFEELKTEDIEKWRLALLERGLVNSSIRNSMYIVTKTYAHFRKQRKIKENPFDYVKMPKTAKPKVSHLSNTDFSELLAAVHTEYELGSPQMVSIYLAIYGGLRKGEICGLRWCDINFDANLISINHSVAHNENGYFLKPPKNDSSIRTFPMVAQLAEMLLNRSDMINPSPNWFVVGDKEKYLSPATLSHRMERLREKYSLTDVYYKRVTMHGLRHNFATTGVRVNMDVRSLASMLGHSDVSMTLNTYADASHDALVMGAAKLGYAFSEDAHVDELMHM